MYKSSTPREHRQALLRVHALKQPTLPLAVLALVAAATLLVPLVFAQAAAARSVSSPFVYTFGSPGVLHETGSMSESSSPYFWLNSGAKLIIKDGFGSTVQGALPTSDRWYTLYASANALDTDGGKYPQNLFRLLTRSTWGNQTDELRFKINDVHTTATPNRDGYSGVLLMSRYSDGSNLYYAGIRMDGEAVIKKKYRGTYYTLGTKTGVFPGSYNKTSAPNLIPEDRFMRLKVETRDNADGSVRIVLSLDRGNGTYEEILSATDKQIGGGVLKSGYSGVRTDYLDASFDYLRITS